ncbi:hypothetical protein GDO81_021721 [Engystomops pustulosus]|uniref:Phosphoinositide phospholipase C n=1 Tax=Engystomops pustulosus TaxID=76066 RepID=A0AAV6Z9J2_ENGPU|nr:hypothetical protein GDO81_021721 [Engystomops pustulosus]
MTSPCCALSISDIETVREGHQSEVLQSIADEFEAELCFTIVFYGRRANLDLVANTAEEAQSWIQGLEKLIETVRNMDQKEILDQWICDWFQKADKNRDGRMNFKEVQDLLKMMNVDMNEQHAYRLFQLRWSDLVWIRGRPIRQRDDVLKIFQDFSKDGKKLTLLEFVDFLRQEQLETENTEEFAMDLIARYEPSETAQKLHALSIDGFLAYLCSVEGCIFSVSHRWGQSSVEGYIRALKRGCRCVEVDTGTAPMENPYGISWPPLTSQNLLQRGISAIKKLPSILSLENNCSVEQSSTMAQAPEKHCWEEKLVTRTLEGRELRGKIILKGKKIGRLEDSLAEPSEDPSMGEISEEEDGGEVDEENIRNEDKKRSKAGSMAKSKDRLSQELSDCILYCKSVPFESFRHSRTHYKLYEMSSFTEYKARKLVREPGNEFVRHNAWQLTRVYPTGLRTDSSNYNPQDMWNVGCQMGYRHVHLLSKDGTKIPPASLFVYIRITDMSNPVQEAEG